MKTSTDPVRFARSVFGAELWSKQAEIAHAIETERRVAVKACHASGKTFDAAAIALWFACRHRNARVITLAPGWLTTRAVIWSEIHSLLQRARFKLPTTVANQTEIRFGPDNLLLGLSANEPTRLQGHHAEHILLIADEATGINPEFWPAVEGILASGDSHLLLLGNPTVNTGYFYDSFGRNRAAWRTFTISAFDTPNLAGISLERLLKMDDAELDDNSHPFLTTRRWVKDRWAEWFNGSPENSPLWQSRVLGEFPSASSNTLIPLTLLEAACRPAIDHGDPVIIGVDPAGPGRDRTVAVACSGGAILDVGVYTDANAEGPVLAFIRKWRDRLKIVRVDSAGIGFYFSEHVRNAGYRTEGVNVASAPDDRERFANLKAQRYWMLRDRFAKGQISGLSDDMLAELAAISYLVNSRGAIEIEDKASVRSTLGRSPDLAEALMIALGDYDTYVDHAFQSWVTAAFHAQAEARRSGPTVDGPATLGGATVPEGNQRLWCRGEDFSRAQDRAESAARRRWGAWWVF
jgi:phage terminase large subunit